MVVGSGPELFPHQKTLGTSLLNLKSRMLKSSQAETGAGPSDQPDSAAGSRCISSAQLFYHPAFHLDFSPACVFFSLLQHTMAEVCQYPCFPEPSLAFQKGGTARANAGPQNLLQTLLIQMTRAIRMMGSSIQHPGHHLSPFTLWGVCVCERGRKVIVILVTHCW